MIFTSNRYKNKNLSLIAALFISLTVLLGLQACSSSDSAPADANPTGYYTGTAAVKDATDADLVITDLQGMINGTRFMAFSDTLKLLYDGTITGITENDFTASVTIYETIEDDIAVVNTTTMSGTITEGSQITGTIEGTGAYNGTFLLVFAQSNNTAADTSLLFTEPASEFWRGQTSESGGYSWHDIQITNDGIVTNFNAPGGGTFQSCKTFSGSLTAITNTQLFDVNIRFLGCSTSSYDGDYAGLATVSNGVLIMAFSDGVAAIAADYTKITF